MAGLLVWSPVRERTVRYPIQRASALRHGVALLLAGCAPTAVDDVLGREGDPARGARVWDAHCAACHAPDGSGTADGVDLTDRVLDPDDLVERVVEGWGSMEGFADTLSPRRTADVCAHVTSSVFP